MKWKQVYSGVEEFTELPNILNINVQVCRCMVHENRWNIRVGTKEYFIDKRFTEREAQREAEMQLRTMCNTLCAEVLEMNF